MKYKYLNQLKGSSRDAIEIKQIYDKYNDKMKS